MSSKIDFISDKEAKLEYFTLLLAQRQKDVKNAEKDVVYIQEIIASLKVEIVEQESK